MKKRDRATLRQAMRDRIAARVARAVKSGRILPGRATPERAPGGVVAEKAATATAAAGG